MFFLIPHEIETLQQVPPWANWLVIGACTLISAVALLGGGLQSGAFNAWILDGFALTGVIGHVFLHVDFTHLLGNMIFLWVFGNAVCTNTHNGFYLATFACCTILSGLTHVLVDGDPAVGASGAINGIVGITLAMYPLNRIHLLWVFMIRAGTVSVTAWKIIIVWFLFDLWGAFMGGGRVAYWAHLGGFLGGLGFGMLALHRGWIQLTEYDNRSLLEIVRGEYPEDMR